MNLKTYLKNKSRQTFAEQIGTTKNYVNLLAIKQKRPSPELALRIEKASNGAVTVIELLYPDHPEMVNSYQPVIDL